MMKQNHNFLLQKVVATMYSCYRSSSEKLNDGVKGWVLLFSFWKCGYGDWRRGFKWWNLEKVGELVRKRGEVRVWYRFWWACCVFKFLLGRVECGMWLVKSLVWRKVMYEGGEEDPRKSWCVWRVEIFFVLFFLWGCWWGEWGEDSR